MTTPTPTPRTDAELARLRSVCPTDDKTFKLVSESCAFVFSRTLERELAAAQARVAELKSVVYPTAAQIDKSAIT